MAPAAIAIDVQRKSTLMKSQWIPTAMSHPAFMHSLLCQAALHQYFLDRGSFKDIIYHRAQAVAAINSAISNKATVEVISDSNIAAVFNLLTLEEAFVHIERNRGDNIQQTDQRQIHYHGLREMISLRGGLSKIGSNRMLQAFILWYVQMLIRTRSRVRSSQVNTYFWY
jgi:hypothetical protein